MRERDRLGAVAGLEHRVLARRELLEADCVDAVVRADFLVALIVGERDCEYALLPLCRDDGNRHQSLRNDAVLASDPVLRLISPAVL